MRTLVVMAALAVVCSILLGCNISLSPNSVSSLAAEDPDSSQMKEQNYQAITQAIAQHKDINAFLNQQPALAKKTFAGKTLLFDAAFFGNADAVKALLNHGADVTVRTASGETPLDRAISSKNPETIAMLKAHGAAPGISKP
jgi:ankyrin repeat protein